MPEFSRQVISLSSSFIQRRAAPDQGGLLTGKDPTEFNTADPLRLWIIQVGLIILTAQLLSLILRKLRQPKVIAEVLGGILLGPTAFGRIPGFSKHIFPEDSKPYLSLVANIGLCLFLFLVGLEIDTAVIKRNARLSITVALAGVAIPFGLGAALAVPLYKHFINPDLVKYTHFMLFTGVAYSITAFPVLCRILTELKLLDTTVGIVVLSAGVGNDIIGWTLLALSVALVNAGSGLTALYILLVCLGWTLVLLFPVRLGFLWLARRTGSVENGPTLTFMTVTILVLFGSAFFTDVIGVHAIFGAFLAGLVVPREGGLAIALTEKLEDMVSIIFLPLYFTLSGLSTDLGLLNTGTVWGFTVAICALAFCGKFGGCTLAARFAGFKWREASTIGSLMSCKGLIELIVLNVGLSAGILTQLVFSMFVFEALVLTFMTTPLVTVLYPPEHRLRVVAQGTPYNNVDGQDKDAEATSRPSNVTSESDIWKRRFTVVLDKIEHVPGMMALTQLLLTPPDYTDNNRDSPMRSSSSRSGKGRERQGVQVDALRLIELSDRTSAVMKSSAAESLIHTDPILGIFRTFGELNNANVVPSLSYVPLEELAPSVAQHARAAGSHLVVVPWLAPAGPAAAHSEVPAAGDWNPFDALFRGHHPAERNASVQHSHFIRSVFAQAGTDVALFVDRAPSVRALGITSAGARQHLFLPFFGGPDDRLALDFVVQLCANPRTSATIVRVAKRDVRPEEVVQQPDDAHLGDEKGGVDEATENARINSLTVTSVTGFPDTVYGNETTQTRLQSETADHVAWARYASPNARELADSATSAALARIEFQELSTPVPLHAILHQAGGLQDAAAGNLSRVLIVLGRSRRLAVESHHAELKDLMEEHGSVGSEVKKTVGDVATAFVLAGCGTGLVVMQAMHALE
ncbi:hypothetical protein DENSPDRAFT_928250 [Dentipellis sp. KUC8613]|nr:hypothetical protein DENSPDRAFT_928250 [Dentipellis sp. KUC8613]